MTDIVVNSDEFAITFGCKKLDIPCRIPCDAEVESSLKKTAIKIEDLVAEIDSYIDSPEYLPDCSIPDNYVIPVDLRFFLENYTRELTTLCNKGFEHFCYPSMCHSIFIPLTHEWGWLSNVYNDDIRNCDNEVDMMNNWVLIYTSGNSIDNRMGGIFMNMNPKSQYYGTIHSYMSSDDGVAKFVANSFTEFIKFAVDNYKHRCIEVERKIREKMHGRLKFLKNINQHL